MILCSNDVKAAFIFLIVNCCMIKRDLDGGWDLVNDATGKKTLDENAITTSYEALVKPSDEHISECDD